MRVTRISVVSGKSTHSLLNHFLSVQGINPCNEMKELKLFLYDSLKIRSHPFVPNFPGRTKMELPA